MYALPLAGWPARPFTIAEVAYRGMHLVVGAEGHLREVVAERWFALPDPPPQCRRRHQLRTDTDPVGHWSAHNALFRTSRGAIRLTVVVRCRRWMLWTCPPSSGSSPGTGSASCSPNS